MGVCADASEYDLQELDAFFLGQRRRIAEQLGMDIRQLFGQHQQFLVGQRRQMDHRGKHILYALSSATAFRQPGAQRLIAV